MFTAILRVLRCRHLGCGPSRLSLRILPLPPSTSVDLEPVKASWSVFDGGKIQSFQECFRRWPERTDTIPVPVSLSRRAGVHRWLRVEPLGPPRRRRRSSLPQSSTATSCTSVARGVLKNCDSHGDDLQRRRIRIQRHRLCASCLSGFVGGGVVADVCQ